jgi:hypothetical protein
MAGRPGRLRGVERGCRTCGSTLLVTYSRIDDERIEPVDSTIAATSLRTAFAHARRYRVVCSTMPADRARPQRHPRPPRQPHEAERVRARDNIHRAVIFTGLFYRAQQLPEPRGDTARRKTLPETSEQRIHAAATGLVGGSVLFRKTSCAVIHAHQVPLS